MTSNCGPCGSVLPTAAKFCHSCGALAPQIAPGPQHSPFIRQIESAIKTTVEPAQTTLASHGSPPRNKRFAVGIAAFVATAILAVAIAVGVTSRNPSSQIAIEEAAETVSRQESESGGSSSNGISRPSPSTDETRPSADVALPEVNETTLDTTDVLIDQEVASGIEISYINALASWSSDGFREMVALSREGSPAWAYGYHLSLGRQSERQAGGGDGRRLEVISSGGTHRICFTSSCSAEISNVVVSDNLVETFQVNGRDLEESISIHPYDSDFVCSAVGFCVALRSTFWFGGTTYSAVEVGISDTAVTKVRKLSVSLELSDGSTVAMSSGTTPNATPNENAFYSLGFRNTSQPWGGTLVVRLRTSLGAETVRLPI